MQEKNQATEAAPASAKDTIPAKGISIKATIGHVDLVFQTHVAADEDIGPKVKEFLTIIDTRKQESDKADDIRAAKRDIFELKDAQRKLKLTNEDYTGRIKVMKEGLYVKVQSEILKEEATLNEHRAQLQEQQTAKNQRLAKSDVRHDERYVAKEDVKINRQNINIGIIENKIKALSLELDNPSAARQEKSQIDQLQIMIDRNITEIGRLESEIQDRQVLIDGVDKSADSSASNTNS